MPGLADDARALLGCAPAEYVAERSRLVKAARARGDREGAKTLQALARPPLALWAALAAGAETAAVQRLYDTTAEVARVQAAGSGRQVLTDATERRRAALDQVVDVAVPALARWEQSADVRRQEIRSVVDRLSRRPDLGEAWLAGVLREVPEDALGFAAFAEVDVAAPSRSESRPPAGPRSKARGAQAPSASDADGDAVPVARAAAAGRTAERRRAQTELMAADAAVASAEEHLERRRETLRRAAVDVEHAEQDLLRAAERRAASAAAVDALDR